MKKFRGNKKFNPNDLPENYFSELVGWTNNKKKPFPDLVNEKTGQTFKSEWPDHSKELNDIEKLLLQIMRGKR